MRVHRRPPSVVRNTVAPLPLAHATSSETALIPRKLDRLPLVCCSHCARATHGATMQTASTLSTRRLRIAVA
jgi:hypothetical protein